MNWQLTRLVNEWLKHKLLLIAVDFDGTLKPFGPTSDEHRARMQATVALLKRCYAIGCRIMIYTCDDSLEKRAEIIKFVNTNEMIVEGINENFTGVVWGQPMKPYANIYLDDRAGLDEALSTLDAAAQIVSLHKDQNTY